MTRLLLLLGLAPTLALADPPIRWAPPLRSIAMAAPSIASQRKQIEAASSIQTTVGTLLMA